MDDINNDISLLYKLLNNGTNINPLLTQILNKLDLFDKNDVKIQKIRKDIVYLQNQQKIQQKIHKPIFQPEILPETQPIFQPEILPETQIQINPQIEIGRASCRERVYSSV